MRRLTGTAAALTAAVLGLTLGATVTAIATTGGSGTAYAGCVAKKTGALYGVTSGTAKCKKKDKAISWNQTGPAGAAGPQGPAGTGATATGQTVTSAYQTASLTVAAGSPVDVLVPGLTATVTVPSGYKVLVSAYGSGRTSSTTAGQFARYSVGLQVDGAYSVDGFFARQSCPVAATGISGECQWSFSGNAAVPAGTHTFRVVGRTDSGGTSGAVIGGDPSSAYQAQLTVTLVKS